MPPKRMSDVLHSSADTTTTTAASAAAAVIPTAPTSSDGPTIPTITTPSTSGAAAASKQNIAVQNGKKRKRTTAASESKSKSDSKLGTGAAAGGGGQERGGAGAREGREGTNHPSLYEPWTLLPARERRALGVDALSGVEVPRGAEGESEGVQKESRRGGAKGKGNMKSTVDVIVWTRNQNIKAGVRRLRGLLCGGPPLATRGGNVKAQREARTKTPDPATISEIRDDAAPRNEFETKTESDAQSDTQSDTHTRLIAVSAQGEGTVKLVGIVDLVRRIGGGKDASKGANGGSKWFVYTVLSSVAVARGGTGAAQDAQDDAEADAEVEGVEQHGDAAAGDITMAMDIDSDDHSDAAPNEGGAVQSPEAGVGTDNKGRGGTMDTEGMKKTPVLIVWFSQTPVPGWKGVFGEGEVTVHPSPPPSQPSPT